MARLASPICPPKWIVPSPPATQLIQLPSSYFGDAQECARRRSLCTCPSLCTPREHCKRIHLSEGLGVNPVNWARPISTKRYKTSKLGRGHVGELPSQVSSALHSRSFIPGFLLFCLTQKITENHVSPIIATTPTHCPGIVTHVTAQSLPVQPRFPPPLPFPFESGSELPTHFQTGPTIEPLL